MSRGLRSYNAEIARHVKFGNHEAAEEARRGFYTELLASKITEVSAKSPRLHPDQVARLMKLLAGVGDQT